jgi:hypothetical protein
MRERAVQRWRPGTLAGLFVVVIAAADEAAYGLALYQQGGPVDSRVFFVASFIGALGALGLVGLLASSPVVRSLAYGFTAAGGVALGILGAFSIGLPLLVVGGLSVYSLGHVRGRSWMLVISASATAILVLIAGIACTSLP